MSSKLMSSTLTGSNIYRKQFSDSVSAGEEKGIYWSPAVKLSLCYLINDLDNRINNSRVFNNLAENITLKCKLQALSKNDY